MNRIDLENKLREANQAYRFGDAIISDIEYDRLLDEYRKLVNPDEYLAFVNSLNEKTNSSHKIVHDFVCGSLNKYKNEEPENLVKFIKSYCPNAMSISAKLDGLSGIAKYRNGKLISFSTRGDGYEGEDITNKAKYIKGLKLSIDCLDDIEIRGELVIRESDFDELLKTQSFSNPRNAVSGIMNQKDFSTSVVEKVSYIAYTILGQKYTKAEQFQYLTKLGFDVAWNIVKTDINLTTINDELFEYASKKFECETDGLVISSPDYKNEDEYRPKAQIAYKTNTQTFTTRLIDVAFEGPSKNGLFIPVGILEPVEIGGVIVSRCTLHNLDFIAEKNIKIGDTVAILRSGDVIPKLISVVDTDSHSVDIELPTECPCCGTSLVKDSLNVRCPNTSCSAQVNERLTLFIKKLGCKHISNATLDNFKIKSFADLIAFRPNKKYKTEITLFDELNSKVFTKSRKELLAAMNFNGIGETLVNKIVDFYGFDNIISNTYVGLPDGVGEITLQKFKDDVSENLRIVDMFINDSRHIEPISIQTTTKKNGFSICFTGKLNTMSRGDATKKAESAGFEVKGGVTKGLTYLCTNDTTTGSSKNKKAKELGTKIITEAEFLSMISDVSVEVDVMTI